MSSSPRRTDCPTHRRRGVCCSEPSNSTVNKKKLKSADKPPDHAMILTHIRNDVVVEIGSKGHCVPMILIVYCPFQQSEPVTYMIFVKGTFFCWFSLTNIPFNAAYHITPGTPPPAGCVGTTFDGITTWNDANGAAFMLTGTTATLTNSVVVYARASWAWWSGTCPCRGGT